MKEVSLQDLDIDLSDISLAFDHDGNVHKKDIGRDYLFDLLGFESKREFVEEVENIREGISPLEDYLYNSEEEYSRGEELSIMISRNEISKKEILDRTRGDGFKEGFSDFLNGAVKGGTTAFIVSSGDEDYLKEFYKKHRDIDVENIHISGTKQGWREDDDGVIKGNCILKGCGTDKKPLRYRESVLKNGHDLQPIVASGDSQGDRKLLEFARYSGGMAISTGKGVRNYANLMVEGRGWYGQIGATLTFAGIMNGMDEDEIREEVTFYLESNFEYDQNDFDVMPGGISEEVYINEKYPRIVLGEKIPDLMREI